MAIQVEERPFGKLKDGSEVNIYKLTNEKGMSVEVSIFITSVQYIYKCIIKINNVLKSVISLNILCFIPAY